MMTTIVMMMTVMITLKTTVTFIVVIVTMVTVAVTTVVFMTRIEKLTKLYSRAALIDTYTPPNIFPRSNHSKVQQQRNVNRSVADWLLADAVNQPFSVTTNESTTLGHA